MVFVNEMLPGISGAFGKMGDTVIPKSRKR